MNLVFALVGILSISLLVGFAAIFLNAWTITVLWAWFVVPIVPTFPVLNYAQALGLAMAIGLLNPRHEDSHCKDERKTSERVANIVGILLWPVVTVAIGFVVRMFV